MSDPLDHFIELWDPIYRGFTPRGLALGLVLTGGLHCPAPDGAHVLYLGHTAIGAAIPAVDYSNAIGVTLPTAAASTIIKNFAWSHWPASSQCAVGLRAVGKGGVEDRNTTQVIRFNTDGSGVPVPRVPNPPINLVAALRPNGFVLLRWGYSQLNQQIGPQEYNVYAGNPISYVTPVDAVGISAYLFDAVAAGFSSGDTIYFGVRSESIDSEEEKNINTVSIVLDMTPPDALPAPVVTYGEEI